MLNNASFNVNELILSRDITNSTFFYRSGLSNDIFYGRTLTTYDLAIALGSGLPNLSSSNSISTFTLLSSNPSQIVYLILSSLTSTHGTYFIGLLGVHLGLLATTTGLAPGGGGGPLPPGGGGGGGPLPPGGGGGGGALLGGGGGGGALLGGGGGCYIYYGYDYDYGYGLAGLAATLLNSSLS